MNYFPLKILFAFLICAGCSSKQETGRLADPVAISKHYTESLKISLSGYELHSVLELQDGNNTIGVRGPDQDEYAKQFLAKLGKRKYWEVCFKAVKPVLGGLQCYYVDKGNKEVLTGYVAQ
ncbi:hypothetical protein V1318_16335 [Lysobacter sp. CCNWLW3]|uniref:hypothetical protein n=1 Tax=unclassified Lysobacter TaxID=2635362 RepID=UPI002FD4ADC3